MKSLGIMTLQRRSPRRCARYRGEVTRPADDLIIGEAGAIASALRGLQTSRSAGQPRLDLGRNRREVCPSGKLRLEDGHHLADAGGAGSAGRGDRGVDERGDRRGVELPRQVARQYLDFGALVLGQIGSAPGLELRDRLLA